MSCTLLLLETGFAVFIHTHTPQGTWRSLCVISELLLSSRDVVTLGALLGRMLPEEPVFSRLVVFATCSGTRRLISVLTTAKLNPPAVAVLVLSFVWHFLIVLITIFSVCSLRVYLPCPQRVSTDRVSF